MEQSIENFRLTIETEHSRLQQISDSEAAREPAPGKWSPKQVIGHLIDSAANNHGRFVRAQFTDDLVVQGYEQEAWVDFQDYKNTDWSALIDLWRAYNLHIARVMEKTPDNVLTAPRAKHNLYDTALVPVPADKETTLEYFMLDYIEHLERHLKQIG